MNKLWKYGFIGLVALILGTTLTATQLRAHLDGPGPGVIHSCVYPRGVIKIVGENNICPSRSTAVDWNEQGPAGESGANGTNGTDGIDGQDGASGPAGPPGPNISVSIIGGGGEPSNRATNSVLSYIPMFGFDAKTSPSLVAEERAQQIFPVTGTVSNFYVRGDNDQSSLVAGPGGLQLPALDRGYVYTVRKNGVSTAMTCTVQGLAKICSDTAHPVSFVEGDMINLQVEPISQEVIFPDGSVQIVDPTGSAIKWTSKLEVGP